MDNTQKVNLIARRLGTTLCTVGIKILQSAFHIDPKILPANELGYHVKSKVKFQNLTLADGKYYLESCDTWKQSIEVDWTDRKKYLTDYDDCDNFTYSFTARMSEIYGINAGIVNGHLYNKDTKKWVAGHFWNMILTKELDLYWYEPMYDLYAKAGNEVVMGKYIYKPLTGRFI